jgi:hypothetical protein
MKTNKIGPRKLRIIAAGVVAITGALKAFGHGGQLDPITAAAAAEPTKAPPIRPVISINVLMVEFVDQAADAIWTAAANPPKKQCEWDEVQYRATQLATTGTLLRVGGTGLLDMMWKDSPDWVPFTEKMTQLALAASQAAKEKNLTALKSVGDQLDLNCEACHRAFKSEIPTQNITTHLSHATPLSQGVKCP